MEFKELIDSFAKRHGIADLAPEDDGVSLVIDGIVVAIVAVGGEIVLPAEIGEPPVEGRAEFADALLEANMESAAFLAKSREVSTSSPAIIHSGRTFFSFARTEPGWMANRSPYAPRYSGLSGSMCPSRARSPLISALWRESGDPSPPKQSLSRLQRSVSWRTTSRHSRIFGYER